MRDIKFRAWDNILKNMNYKVIVGMWGEYVLNDENYTACSMLSKRGWVHFEPYQKEIYLMQYTGFKDCKGREIYENDIVYINTFIDKQKGEIIFEEGKWEVIIDTNKKSDLYEYVFYSQIEVVGNIFEN